MEYDFKAIESKWQAYWAGHGQFKVTEDKTRPKF